VSLPILSLVTFVPLLGALAILAMPRAQSARWVALGVEPAPMTPQAFDQWIRDDIATSIKLARAAHIKAD